jgi:hypothetical protein
LNIKEQLVHANLTFAVQVADMQEGITKNLIALIDLIAEMTGFKIKPSEYCEVALIPPVVLILQLIEATSGSANNVTATFQNMQLPFDPYYFLQKYVPFVNWDDFKKQAQIAYLEKKTENDLAAGQGAGGPPPPGGQPSF